VKGGAKPKRSPPPWRKTNFPKTHQAKRGEEKRNRKTKGQPNKRGDVYLIEMEKNKGLGHTDPKQAPTRGGGKKKIGCRKASKKKKKGGKGFFGEQTQKKIQKGENADPANPETSLWGKKTQGWGGWFGGAPNS